MDIYSLIKLVGGLAFFLYGMNVMSDGLEKSSDGKIEKYLGAITKNKFFALIFGASIAGIPITSSISPQTTSGRAEGRSILFITGNISRL